MVKTTLTKTKFEKIIAQLSSVEEFDSSDFESGTQLEAWASDSIKKARESLTKINRQIQDKVLELKRDNQSNAMQKLSDKTNLSTEQLEKLFTNDEFLKMIEQSTEKVESNNDADNFVDNFGIDENDPGEQKKYSLEDFSDNQ